MEKPEKILSPELRSSSADMVGGVWHAAVEQYTLSTGDRTRWTRLHIYHGSKIPPYKNIIASKLSWRFCLNVKQLHGVALIVKDACCEKSWTCNKWSCCEVNIMSLKCYFFSLIMKEWLASWWSEEAIMEEIIRHVLSGPGMCFARLVLLKQLFTNFSASEDVLIAYSKCWIVSFSPSFVDIK